MCILPFKAPDDYKAHEHLQDFLLLHPTRAYPHSSSESQDADLITHRRSPRSQHGQDEETGSLIRTPRQPSQGNSYDGANESSYGSRVTSTTWSSVSKVSAANFTQFAGSSHGLMRAKCNEEYNALASKHDLPPLLVPSSGERCLKLVVIGLLIVPEIRKPRRLRSRQIPKNESRAGSAVNCSPIASLPIHIDQKLPTSRCLEGRVSAEWCLMAAERTS